jgi:hypothetical protein
MNKFFGVLVIFLFLFVGCGSDDCEVCPRPPRPSGSPPVISNLQCNPASAAVGQGGGAITMDCSLFFRDPDGDLDAVVFSYIDGCGDDPGPLDIDVRGQAGVQEDGDIDLENLQIKTNCVAEPYTYEFVAEDGEGSESNELILQFVLVEPTP